jgi:hypothetical protein
LKSPQKKKRPVAQLLSRRASPESPIDNIAFYVEKHSTTPDWRKMLMAARRLRSLTERVFPVLHLHTIGVYWVDNDSTTTLAQTEAFDRGRALFFNADALCICSDIAPVPGRVPCALQRFEPRCVCLHRGAPRGILSPRWKTDQMRTKADGDDKDIKIDIEFEALFEEYAFSQMKFRHFRPSFFFRRQEVVNFLQRVDLAYIAFESQLNVQKYVNSRDPMSPTRHSLRDGLNKILKNECVCERGMCE